MAGIGKHARYWNATLQPLYERVAITPINGQYTNVSTPLESDKRCSTHVITPSCQLVSSPIKADTFESLLVPNNTDLLPPRPCFAQFPYVKKTTTSRRKEKLSTGHFFRSIKVRLKPTAAQSAVLRTWMGCAQAHYNTAIDILNTLYDGWGEEEYLSALRDHHPSLCMDEEHDGFWWYQVMESGQICHKTNRPAFRSNKRKKCECIDDNRCDDCDPEEHGLREIVHELLSAAPDYEKMAPSAAAVYKDMRWTQDAPRNILDAAVKEACDALVHNLAKSRPGSRAKKKGFHLQFRSLRNLSHTPTQTLRLDATRSSRPTDTGIHGPISRFTTCPDSKKKGNKRMDFLMYFATNTGMMKGLGAIKCTDSKRVVESILKLGHTQHESQILWDKRTRKFYLILKYVVQRPMNTKALGECDVVGFDPGVRAFQAFSCPDGRHGELILGGREQMHRRAKYCERLQSTADKMKAAHGDFDHQQTRYTIKRDVSTLCRRKPHTRRRSIEARTRRARVKTHNWMKNMHYEAIKATFALGDLVVMPVLESERISARATRIFGTGVAKDTYAWSHYSFMQRLWHKSQITANKHVVFTCEPGTTKTCDKCGYVHDVGRAKVFRCTHCHHVAGRDMGHASRGNILSAIGAAQNTPWDGIIRNGQANHQNGSVQADADGISPL